jgi:hypothetical protein
MPLHESQYGRDGLPAENSAISGKALEAGDAFFSINGYSLGIKAREMHAITPEEFNALRAEWVGELPAAVAVPESLTPAYDEMSLEELKAAATERNVNITGRRSKEDIKQALRAADVMERFAPPPLTPEGDRPLDLGKAVGE